MDCMGFPDGSAVKNPPSTQKTRIQSLGQEDPLKEEMATHSSILAWEIPWTEEPGGLQSYGVILGDNLRNLLYSRRTLPLQPKFTC